MKQNIQQFIKQLYSHAGLLIFQRVVDILTDEYKKYVDGDGYLLEQTAMKQTIDYDLKRIQYCFDYLRRTMSQMHEKSSWKKDDDPNSEMHSQEKGFKSAEQTPKDKCSILLRQLKDDKDPISDLQSQEEDKDSYSTARSQEDKYPVLEMQLQEDYNAMSEIQDTIAEIPAQVGKGPTLDRHIQVDKYPNAEVQSQDIKDPISETQLHEDENRLSVNQSQEDVDPVFEIQTQTNNNPFSGIELLEDKDPISDKQSQEDKDPDMEMQSQGNTDPITEIPDICNWKLQIPKKLICGKERKYLMRSKQHLQQIGVIRRQKTYTCHSCCKSFKQYSDLRCHVKIHRGTRPFICKV